MVGSTTSTYNRRLQSLTYFDILLGFTHFVGFVTICLSGYFMNTYSDGMGWPNKKNFGGSKLHGFLMLLAFVFFQGEALLAYRVYRYNVKILSKLIHTMLHICALGLGIFALVLMIVNKNLHNADHFNSVHSWIGVSLLTIYILQFTFGFLTFLCPCSPGSYRARLLPLHRIVGAGCMIIGCIQCVIGFTTIINSPPACFSNLTCANRLEYVAYLSIMFIVLYTLLVLALIVPNSWKREKTPDEMN